VAELAELVEAYNQVTERLQASHDLLNSEVNRLREQLTTANEALQRSRRLAALGEMAAGIAHEIRNPLTSIHLYAGMLSKDLADRPESRSIADQIAQAVRSLDAVVNDVLSFARELVIRPTEADYGDSIEQALRDMQPMLAHGDISLHVDRPEELVGRFDSNLLQRVLCNLVRNAVEAMQDGGELTVTARKQDAFARLVIRDTGPGIEPESVDRIFNPFFTTRHTGTGLGLAIVHRIIDAHGGSISVHNDGGAVFTIDLPLAGPIDGGRRCDQGETEPGPHSHDEAAEMVISQAELGQGVT
jgi:signal transduction histidine kinase